MGQAHGLVSAGLCGLPRPSPQRGGLGWKNSELTSHKRDPVQTPVGIDAPPPPGRALAKRVSHLASRLQTPGPQFLPVVSGIPPSPLGRKGRKAAVAGLQTLRPGRRRLEPKEGHTWQKAGPLGRAPAEGSAAEEGGGLGSPNPPLIFRRSLWVASAPWPELKSEGAYGVRWLLQGSLTGAYFLASGKT